MEVLDGQDERLPTTAGQENLPQGLVGAGLEHRRAQFCETFRASVDAEYVQQIGCPCVRIDPYGLQTQPEFASDRLRRICLTDLAVLPNEVKYREIGCGAAVGQTTPYETRHMLVLKTL